MQIIHQNIDITNALGLKQDHEIKEILHIKKQVYLINTINDSYILKFNPNTSILNDILRPYKTIKFKRELLVYKSIQNLWLTYFNSPKLMFYNNRYFLLEHISGNIDIDYGKTSEQHVKEALLEFNYELRKAIKNKLIVISSFNSIKLLKVILKNISIYCGIIFSLKALWLFVVYSTTNKRNKESILLHNDLSNECNKITANDGVLYFIDFESVSYEKKWILTDIINISFNISSLSFNKNLFKLYVDSLDPMVRRNICINHQVRISLIRLCGNLLLYKKHREKHMQFLKNTILVNKNYNKWYSKNINIKN